METDLETIKNEILKKNLCIQNILKSIQEPGVTETDILLLNSDYRNEYRQLKQLIENFEKLVKEDYEDSELIEDVDLYQSQLVSFQTFFRKVNIQSQLNINLQKKNELFYCSPDIDGVRNRSKNSREELIKISSSTTAKLASISQEVANIVDQSKNTLDVLAQSSQVVTDTREEYKTMGNVISSTKKLVSRYGRRETTDLILIFLAVCLFFAACVYVIQKRVF